MSANGKSWPIAGFGNDWQSRNSPGSTPSLEANHRPGATALKPPKRLVPTLCTADVLINAT